MTRTYSRANPCPGVTEHHYTVVVMDLQDLLKPSPGQDDGIAASLREYGEEPGEREGGMWLASLGFFIMVMIGLGVMLTTIAALLFKR